MLALVCFFPGCIAVVETGHEIESRRGIVVCVDSIASKVGADVLKDGGNAVDAAVATAYTLAVTHPQAGNLGGGGFMLIWMEDEAKLTAIDFRERAPALSRADMFLKPDGTVDKDRVRYGFLASGIPGTVAGTYLAHEKYGSLDWYDLMEPACCLAEQGFDVGYDLWSSFRKAEKGLRRFDSSVKAYFGPEGKLLNAGDRLVQPDLGHTLRMIQFGGRDAFYTGEVARELVRAVRLGGGIMNLRDLDSYHAKEVKPLKWEYGDVRVAAMGLPSSGGVVLRLMLNILSGFNLEELDEGERAHLLAETMRVAYKDRAVLLGDPDFTQIPLAELFSSEYATRLRSGINLSAAAPSRSIAPNGLTIHEEEEVDSSEDAGTGQTTHFCVVDRKGNIVSCTYTLERSFGCKAVAGSTGVLLNNEMGDFNLRPGWTDEKGAIGTDPNIIQPGKRMLSSMCPVILFRNNRPFAAFGSPGGRSIINTVLQVIINKVDLGMSLKEAVRAPRIHHQWFPDRVCVEKSVPTDIREFLKERGHDLKEVDYQGDCHAISIRLLSTRPADSWKFLLQGVADDRIDGCAAGF